MGKRKKDTKMDGTNWISNFTKSGCIACRNSDGKVTHKGRKSITKILIMEMNRFPRSLITDRTAVRRPPVHGF